MTLGRNMIRSAQVAVFGDVRGGSIVVEHDAWRGDWHAYYCFAGLATRPYLRGYGFTPEGATRNLWIMTHGPRTEYVS